MTQAPPRRTVSRRDVRFRRPNRRRCSPGGWPLRGSACTAPAGGTGDELILLNVTAARSCLTVTDGGRAQWHYEPASGPAIDPATLTAINVHILGAPHTADITRGLAAYRAFPLKGAVGRCLQDRGLTVTLRICEDLESFEATTEIEITSPARPWLGAIRLADNGYLDWDM